MPETDSSLAVLQVPSAIRSPAVRLYRSAEPDAALYLDSPASPLPPGRALGGVASDLPGDADGLPALRVSFRADRRLSENLYALRNGRQAQPIPWKSAPVFAWTRADDGVLVVACSRTNSEGVARLVPRNYESGTLEVAAELFHWGQLVGASVRASARPGVLEELEQRVRLGSEALWSATLADALLRVIRDLFAWGHLTLELKTEGLDLLAAREIQELVFLEWARRLAPGCSLAVPAATVSALRPVVDWGVEWLERDRLPLRSVRRFRVRRRTSGVPPRAAPPRAELRAFAAF